MSRSAFGSEGSFRAGPCGLAANDHSLKRTLTRTCLVNALNNFPPRMFVKIDRAEVVSVFYIDNVTKEYLIMNGKTVSIARSYYKYVIAGINIVE